MLNLFKLIPTKLSDGVLAKYDQADEYGNKKTTDSAVLFARKETVVAAVTYVAEALPGTLQATAGWRVRKEDATTGLVITWADGDNNFDNVATDLTTLTYS